jgi:hypothetical protein
MRALSGSFSHGPISRRGILLGALAAAVAPRAALAAKKPVFAPHLTGLAVSGAGGPFAWDHRLLATVSPLRPTASIHFALDRAATVKVEAVKTVVGEDEIVWSNESRLEPGRHRLEWKVDPALPARTYLLRLTVTDRRGLRRVYGANRPYVGWLPRAPVVRVLGVEAAFAVRSCAPGQRADLLVSTDAEAVKVQVFRCGSETVPTYRNDEMNGVPVTEPVTLDWRDQRQTGRIKLRVGEWPTGLYFARVEAADGRVGFAPLVVRPAQLGRSRAAVVLPTNTWQAYNHRDSDGDGWGDTWYAGGNPAVRLDRPHLNHGVPFRFKSYDHGFIRWLDRRKKDVDYFAEDDLEDVASGDALRAAYDLVVFPGHTEYVTAHAYDVVRRFRDLGGSLMFLSANNLFWRVERRGQELVRRGLWRDLGRPEAELAGVQYLANDSGRRRGGFVVAADSPEWPWVGTGVGPGGRFGSFGIEIDARTPNTPPGTQVLATIPDVFGPGRSAEMTYYETAAGAKVFAAGVLTFGGSAGLWVVGHLLENVWARLMPQAQPEPGSESPSSDA